MKKKKEKEENGMNYSRSLNPWRTLKKCDTPLTFLSIIYNPDFSKYKYRKVIKLFYSP